MKTVDELNQISGTILKASISVHKEMGPGLPESVYQHCLIKELDELGLNIKTLLQVPLSYKGHLLNKDYFIEILVEDEIILELKTVEGVLPVHEAQLLSYRKLSNKRLGLLINFNVPLLKNGFKRLVNNL
jgi:GxxExxY protein